MSRIVLTIIVGAVGGCNTVNPHVALSAPPASAPLSEREEAYERLRPLGVAGDPDFSNQLGWLNVSQFPFLQLADGHRVVDAADLAAVVDEGSLTAKAADKADDLRLVTNALWTGGMLGVGVGVGVALAGPVVVSGGDFNSVSAGFALSIVGLGLVTGGSIATVVATEFAGAAEAEKMSAFLLYDGDLRRRLALPKAPSSSSSAPLPPVPPSVVDPPPVVVPLPTPAPVDPSGD